MQGQGEIVSDSGMQAELIDCFKKRWRNEPETNLEGLQRGLPEKREKLEGNENKTLLSEVGETSRNWSQEYKSVCLSLWETNFRQCCDCS